MGTRLHALSAFLDRPNVATSEFWWWPLSPHHRRFYDSIRDLETGLGVEVEGAPLQVFRAQRPALTDGHIRNLVSCFASLPDPHDQRGGQAMTHYLGGLTFISLNGIQWRCDAQAFSNFLISFKL